MGALSPIAKVPAKAPLFEFSTPTKAPVLEYETPSSSPEPEKKSRRKYDFPIETLQAFSHFRQDEAAKRLKVSPITLKRICHRHKYRWPYRTIKAQTRRAAKLEAQRLQRQAEFSARRTMTPPPSPSTLAPELLLRLREGHKNKSFNTSPTSVSHTPSPTYPSTPMAEYPPQAEPTTTPQLPPLSLLLAKHQHLSMNATPANRPNRLSYPQTHHNYRVNYKSPIYAASYDPSAPKFPLARLAALSMGDIDRRGF